MFLAPVNRVTITTLVLIAGLACSLCAEDWPMWRFDANRSASSPENLKLPLKPAWVREYSPRVPAWEDPLNQDLMTFDLVFEPVVLGERMFLAFNDRDKLVALDIRTGRELWTFYTDGPVRMAPAAWSDKVYFTSDDGCLYCVRAEDGSLVWKFRGGPSQRKALGNSRLVSAWPARGGPVIRDGVVYFAAGIWPFMGTFIYALDAATGRVIWLNDSTGSQFIKQPHNTSAYGGVAPQGCLVATRDLLLVPGGRSVPAAFNRQMGHLLYFRIGDSDKGTGGSVVMANENEFFVHTRLRGTRAHDLTTGRKSSFILNEPVLAQNRIYAASFSTNRNELERALRRFDVAAYEEAKARAELADAYNAGDLQAVKNHTRTWNLKVDDLAKAKAALEKEQAKPSSPPEPVIRSYMPDKQVEWEIKADGSGDLIQAGNHLFAAGSNAIVAIRLHRRQKPSIEWSIPITNSVRRLLAANGMLFAVTMDGGIMAFTPSQGSDTVFKETFANPAPTQSALERAREISQTTGAREGYAFYLGLDDGSLLTALATETQLRIIGVDNDSNKVERLRRQLDSAGLYGIRASLMAADPGDFGAPPYIANLIVADAEFARRLADATVLQKVFQSVRPYGGALWINTGGNGTDEIASKAREAQLSNAVVRVQGNAVIIVREGPLPGSADWTHQYGNVANTVKSDDKTVKLPLGVLWFGGNSHTNVLPRHGHGPSEQVAAGRLFVEGYDSISARDVYTGRPLWQTVIPGLDTYGIYYDETHIPNPLSTIYGQRHIPGANARGANYVVTADSVYVAVQDHCAVLEAATGKITRNIPMPAIEGQRQRPEWAFIGVCDDVLLGGTGYAQPNKRLGLSFGWPPPFADLAASAGLAAFNRHTGELLWQVPARHGFFHNAIVAGNGLVYCLDRLPKSAESRYKLKEGHSPQGYRIVAFELHTGKVVWEQTNDIFGTWLSYSKEHDVLLFAGANARDRLKDEADKGMMVLRAKDGSVVWKNLGRQYNGPCILHNDLIITTPPSDKLSAGAFRLLDGQPHTITNMITGEPQRWRIFRSYGCNTPVASEYLLTFRSGAAGFYDLENHTGTGNFGGFKSGCSPNLIAANGILNAPDYTRTCSCPYQNQTSLGLVHMPEAEMWACNTLGVDAETVHRIVRLGLNLGAPGDRVDTNGTLWIEYPPVPGYSPRLPLTIESSGTNEFRRYSAMVSGDGPSWVMASGLRGIRSLTLRPISLKTIEGRSPGATTHPDKYKDYERTTIFDFDQAWRYNSNGLDLGTEWRTETYDDSAWPVGKGLLGFEDKPEEYPQPFRTLFKNYSRRIITYYFRTTFVYDNNLSNIIFQAQSYIDDGALFYLNGREIGACRLGSGARFDTEAAIGAPEKELYYFEFSPEFVRPGTNLVAVEVHQFGHNSSDIVFGMKLDAIHLKPEVDTNQLASTDPLESTNKLASTNKFASTNQPLSTNLLASNNNNNGNEADLDEDADPDERPAGLPGARRRTVNVIQAPSFPDARVEANYPQLRPAFYTVRLYFMEPDPVSPGQRVFNIRLQNRRVMTDFDILKAAGGPNRGVKLEFKNVLVGKTLQINLDKTPASELEPVLSGVEIVFEREQ